MDKAIKKRSKNKAKKIKSDIEEKINIVIQKLKKKNNLILLRDKDWKGLLSESWNCLKDC